MATVTGAFCCDATDAVEVERRRSRDPSRDDPPGWRWETMPTPSPSSSAAAGAPSASPSSVPSYHDEVDPARYDDMLAAKVARLRDRFAPLLRRGALEAVDSDPGNDVVTLCNSSMSLYINKTLIGA